MANTNSYYNRIFSSQENTLARAADVKQDLDAVQSGFDKLPTPYTGVGTKGFNSPLRVADGVSSSDAVSKGQLESYASPALQVGTSVSPNTIGIGAKTFVIAESIARAWVVGTQLRATATPGNYMIGTVTSYTAGLVTLDMDYRIGSGSFESWVLSPQALAIAVTFSSGSAATPGLQVDGQSGDGLYSRSTGDVSFATGGARRMSITNGAIEAAVPIALPADAISALQAVPKQQLDANVATVLAYTDTAFTSGTYTVAGNKTYTNPAHTLQTLTDGASIAWNANSGQMATVTLGGNRAVANPTNLKNGSYLLRIQQDATGGRTLTWGSVFKWPGGSAPILSSAANAVDIATFVCVNGELHGTVLRGFA